MSDDEPEGLSGDALIEYLWTCRRNQRETILVLLDALKDIRDMRSPVDDNATVRFMRDIARQAIGEPDDAEDAS